MKIYVASQLTFNDSRKLTTNLDKSFPFSLTGAKPAWIAGELKDITLPVLEPVFSLCLLTRLIKFMSWLYLANFGGSWDAKQGGIWLVWRLMSIRKYQRDLPRTKQWQTTVTSKKTTWSLGVHQGLSWIWRKLHIYCFKKIPLPSRILGSKDILAYSPLNIKCTYECREE